MVPHRLRARDRTSVQPTSHSSVNLLCSDVTDVVPGAPGLYVLRGVPFPGDASGNGWEVDLINPTTGRILETASGDAAPMSLLLAFGSVWVSTGTGASRAAWARGSTA